MIDILLHVLGAVTMVAVPGMLMAYFATNVVFTILLMIPLVPLVCWFWIDREADQAREKYGRDVPFDEWSKQKTKEAIGPAAAAVLTAVAVIVSKVFLL